MLELPNNDTMLDIYLLYYLINNVEIDKIELQQDTIKISNNIAVDDKLFKYCSEYIIISQAIEEYQASILSKNENNIYYPNFKGFFEINEFVIVSFKGFFIMTKDEFYSILNSPNVLWYKMVTGSEGFSRPLNKEEILYSYDMIDHIEEIGGYSKGYRLYDHEGAPLFISFNYEYHELVNVFEYLSNTGKSAILDIQNLNTSEYEQILTKYNSLSKNLQLYIPNRVYELSNKCMICPCKNQCSHNVNYCGSMRYKVYDSVRYKNFWCIKYNRCFK